MHIGRTGNRNKLPEEAMLRSETNGLEELPEASSIRCTEQRSLHREGSSPGRKQKMSLSAIYFYYQMAQNF